MLCRWAGVFYNAYWAEGVGSATSGVFSQFFGFVRTSPPLTSKLLRPQNIMLMPGKMQYACISNTENYLEEA